MKLMVIVHEAKEGDFWREVPPFLADDLTPLLEKGSFEEVNGDV